MSIDNLAQVPVSTGSQPHEVARTRDLTSRLRVSLHVGGPVVGLIVMVVALSMLSPYFLTGRNLSNILSQISDVGIMAAGAFLVILIGGIDLSVAAVMALTMMVSGWLYAQHGLPFVLALVIGLLVGALIGLINGALLTIGKVQAFVATLATMSAALGLDRKSVV